MIRRVLTIIAVLLVTGGDFVYEAQAAPPRPVCRPGQFEKVCQISAGRLFIPDECAAPLRARVGAPCTCVFNTHVFSGRITLGEQICCMNGQFC